MSADLMREKMDATLQEWKGKIDELKGHARHMKAEQRKAFLSRVQELERDRTEMESRWAAAKNLGAEAWDKIKQDVNKTYENLKQKFDAAQRERHSEREKERAP